MGRAVDDAHHPADVFAHERLNGRIKDATSDGGLEEQIDAVLGGNGVQLRPVRSEKFLGRDDRLAVLERGADERQRRVGAADELHNDVGLGISDDRRSIGGEQRRIRQTVLVLGGVADGAWMRSSTPVRAVMVAWRASSRSTSAPPTVPQPSVRW